MIDPAILSDRSIPMPASQPRLRSVRIVAGAAALVVVGGLAGTSTSAHKAITSKYTYNAEIYPILRDRCGQCHIEGGVAPMSLLTYRDAVPWAEAMREELLNERMPPWHALEGSTTLKGSHVLTPRELDTVIEWATGGSPEGDRTKRPPDSKVAVAWKTGEPDLVVAKALDHKLTEEQQTDAAEFTVATGVSQQRWLRLVDLLPSNPGLVRSATISLVSGTTKTFLVEWIPGEVPSGAPEGTGFKLPANAQLHVAVRYKKPWQDERNAVSDSSKIGLYFAAAASRDLTVLSVEPTGATDKFSKDVAAPVTLVAIRPELDQPYGTLNVQAHLPNGTVVPLLRLKNPTPTWPRRYWLEKPMELPKSTRLEVTTAIDPDAQPSTGIASASLRIALDVAASK